MEYPPYKSKEWREATIAVRAKLKKGMQIIIRRGTDSYYKTTRDHGRLATITGISSCSEEYVCNIVINGSNRSRDKYRIFLDEFEIVGIVNNPFEMEVIKRVVNNV